MPVHVEKVWGLYRTNPHGRDGHCRLDRRPRVQLDDGHLRRRLFVPHLRRRAHQRESRHREEVQQIGRIDFSDWRCDGVVGNILPVVP